jgi:ornithine carbamoyltransferase
VKGKSLLSVADLTAAEIERLFQVAREMKLGLIPPRLQGKAVALIFEKPSLRTRVSFEVAVSQLGGKAIYLSQAEVGLGKREAIPDVARTLSRYVNAIVVRTFAQADLALLARWATVPVINALTDEEHPCQALADLLTIKEKKGRLEGVALAYIGDGNNVCHSLMLASALMGVDFHMAHPQGYGPRPEVVDKARALAPEPSLSFFERPEDAVAGVEVVYTDVWTSMGQEAQAEAKRKAFARFQVNEGLMARAARGALFMHPLPAHRGEEVSPGLLEHPQSVVFDQAENRLHLQRALLAEILG